MYEAYYQLTADPFRLTPDHRFCYRNDRYKRALLKLKYTLHLGEGFIMITGAPGVGKATLVNELLADTSTQRTVARLESSRLRVDNVLQELASSFGLSASPNWDRASLYQRLKEFLAKQSAAQNKGLLLLRDAHTLSLDTLEEVRLLGIFQAGGESLLQIVLIGQSELVKRVHGAGMEQLSQRILAAYEVPPLEAEDTQAYLAHRLQTAGWKGNPQLGDELYPVIYEFSRGVPRQINKLCRQLFLYGCSLKKHALALEDLYTAISALHEEAAPRRAKLLTASFPKTKTPPVESSRHEERYVLPPSLPASGTDPIPISSADGASGSTHASLEGTVLNGRFRLISRIGSGAISSVYKALDQRRVEVENDSPYVAIKVLDRKFRKHGDWLIALHQVAHQFIELKHPNIAKVYDLDRDGSLVYLVMEYVSGRSLRKIIDEPNFKGISIKAALRIANSIGDAMAFIHRSGIRHSDLRPDNIIITDNGEFKVFDFGISRSIEQDVTPTSNLKTSKSFTPQYASLEKLENRHLDQRDDIYAFACTFYEILTGKHPFNKLPATLANEKKLQPVKPSSLNHRQWKALGKALEFVRNKRTPNMVELLTGLNPKRPFYQSIRIHGAAAPIAYPISSKPLSDAQLPLKVYPTAPASKQRLVVGTVAFAGFLGGFVGFILGSYWFLPGSFETIAQGMEQHIHERVIDPPIARVVDNNAH